MLVVNQKLSQYFGRMHGPTWRSHLIPTAGIGDLGSALHNMQSHVFWRHQTGHYNPWWRGSSERPVWQQQHFSCVGALRNHEGPRGARAHLRVGLPVLVGRTDKLLAAQLSVPIYELLTCYFTSPNRNGLALWR